MIKKMFKYIAVLILCFATISCGGNRGKLYPVYVKLPQKGNYKLIQASRDGCDTAISSRGTSFFRTFYTFRQDPFFINDPAYFDSWSRAYIYCFHVINSNAFTPLDARFNNDAVMLNFGPNNLNSAIGTSQIDLPMQSSTHSNIWMFEGGNIWDQLFVSVCDKGAAIMTCK